MCYETKEKFSYIIHYTVNHVLSESLLTMSTIHRGVTCCQSPRNGFIAVAEITSIKKSPLFFFKWNILFISGRNHLSDQGLIKVFIIL